jgi:iron(III) transport system permease protein
MTILDKAPAADDAEQSVAAPSTSSRVMRAGRRLYRMDPKYWIFGVVTAILVYEIMVPLGIMLWTSLSEARPGSPEFFDLGNLSVSNYGRALTATAGEAAMNTLVFSVGVTVISFILGGYLAWVVERTNTPLRKLITALCLLRLIIPGVMTTVSWIILASPQTGILNDFLQHVLPWMDGPVLDVFTMKGMIWVEALDVIPLAFLLMSAALRSTDPSLEEASLMAGKGRLLTTFRITFPLILPAMLATLILILIRGFETFEVPALIGLPAGIYTFVIEIYLNTNGVPSDSGLAAVYAVAVLAFCACLITFYNRMTRNADSFATISGKAFRPRTANLGRGRWVTLAIALLILMASVGLPLLVIIWASFSPPFQPIQPFTAEGVSNFTMENYERIFANPTTIGSFLNSTILSVGAAVIIVFLISIVAWITVKTKIRGRKLLDHLAFAPIAIPAVTMGVAFLWFYLSVPIPVYGTLWILLLLYVARFTPVVMRVMSASMTQIDDELLEASQVTGASWWRSFRTIALPLLRPGLIAGGIFVMIHAFRELSASLFVYTGGNEVVGVTMFSLWDDGSYGLLTAFGVMVLLVVAILSLIANLISSRFGIRK